MAPAPPPAPGLRVLLSAFSCRPGRGSEPGAGWQWARAAAQVADVQLLTERANQPFIEAALAQHPLPGLHPVYVDLPQRLGRWSQEDQRIRLRYALWQYAVRRAARRMHTRQPFDVVHHLTFSADWQPVGVPALPGAGFVWGPVGGAAPVPWRLARWLAPSSWIGELARTAAGVAGRRVFGDPVARRADVVLCQNRHVSERFAPRARDVRLEPNVALDRGELEAISSARGASQGPPRAVFAGRLQDWKGLRLAVATLAQPECSDWRLVVMGDGPGRPGAEQLADRLGVRERLEMLGPLPRPEALQCLADAEALLLPSMHDACGWVVAEALALGTPVICLDVGGPPLLLSRAGATGAVPVSRDPTPALAAALVAGRGSAGTASRAFDSDRLPGILAEVYAQAADRR